VDDLGHESALVRDPPRPVTLEAVLQGLRLRDALVAVAGDVGEQGVDPLEHLAVLLLPPEAVLAGELVPDELHRCDAQSRRSRLVPPSDSSRSIAARSRLAFSGLHSR
jgi:hypothetical protein